MMNIESEENIFITSQIRKEANKEEVKKAHLNLRAKRILKLKQDLLSVKEEMDKLKAKSANLNGAIESHYASIEKLFSIDDSKFIGDGVILSYRESTSTEIIDPSLVPAPYCVVKVEPNKTLIKAAFLQGKEVPGARLLTNYNLQIDSQ